MRAGNLGILLFLMAAAASGQATSPYIKVTLIAEVETRVLEGDRQVVHLVAADRVVPGDLVHYTLEIQNTGVSAVVAPTVSNPIPAHTTYLADSATGPGAIVMFSADGGHSFNHADSVKTAGVGGVMRLANASDYTNIRWQFKKTLKSKSVAFARFRAVVK